MAKDLNKVQITGRLGADPKMKFTPGGTAVTSFQVAARRTRKGNDGENHEDTEWFRIVAWNRLGEVCNEYLAKGDRVYLEGRLQTRQWQDQEGQTRFTTEVVAQDMIMLESRNRHAPSADSELSEETEEETEAPPTRVGTPSTRSKGNSRPSVAVPARSKASIEEEELPI